MTKFWQFKNTSETSGELMLYGDIRSEKPWWDDGDNTVYPKQFNDDLKALGNISQLTVRINSMGGDVFAANAIYTMLKAHPSDVTVQIDGIAASAATIIAMAGDKIQAPSNSMFMIHDPLLVLWGMYNAEDMKKMSDVLETVKESILNAYVNKTGRDRAELSDLMSQETWMTADEALAEGFIDEILFEDSIDASVTNDGRFMVVNSIAHDLTRFQTRPQMGKKQVNKTNATPAIVQQPRNFQKDGESKVEIKNLEDLKKHFPDLCNQLEMESAKNAATQERDRMKAIDDISATISPELVNKAKYETPMSAQDLAFEALKADAAKGENFVKGRDQELNPNNEVGSTPVPDTTTEANGAMVDRIAAAANQKRTKEAQR